jgi:hypothetical protein
MVASLGLGWTLISSRRPFQLMFFEPCIEEHKKTAMVRIMALGYPSHPSHSLSSYQTHYGI